MKRFYSASLILLCALAACAPEDSQNQYSYRDVGQSSVVHYGRVVNARPVNITGENTGTGGLVGAGVGGGLGAYTGGGSGQIWTTAAGALAGALAGSAAEQKMASRTGIEYIVTLDNGQTLTLVQNKASNEPVFPPGARVMVQTQGSYQRVLPAN